MSAALPDAPAASLRRALEWVYDLSWPASEDAEVPTAVQRIFDATAEATFELDRDLGRRHRFAELAGPVVRSVQLTEIHVHDVPRALAAARERGFEPAPEDERADGDGEDLLGAVSWLLEEDPEPPGCDQYTSLGSIERLDAADGEELVGWSEVPVTETFTGGWHTSADHSLEASRSDLDLDGEDEGGRLERRRRETPPRARRHGAHAHRGPSTVRHAHLNHPRQRSAGVVPDRIARNAVRAAPLSLFRYWCCWWLGGFGRWRFGLAGVGVCADSSVSGRRSEQARGGSPALDA